jgi:hypothetical protein
MSRERLILPLLGEPLPAQPERAPLTRDELLATQPEPTVLPQPVPLIERVSHAAGVIAVWLAIFAALALVGVARHHGWYTPCPYGHEVDTTECVSP